MTNDYIVDRTGRVILNRGESVAGMRYPVRCRFCSNVHDSGSVQVIARYADCDVWKCPGCDASIDNRPEGWGGSAFPLPGHPNYRGGAA